MLKIRRAQLEVFEQAALKKFEDDMVVHSKEFSPKLSQVLGDEQLRVAIRQAISRARTHGLTNRGPVRLFIDMMFLFGSAFDTDPQYPWAARILRSSEDQMQRADWLHAQILEYQEKVSGPGAVNTRNALKGLAELARQQLTFTADTFVADMLNLMESGFPQKASYIGSEALEVLIREASDESRRYGLRPYRDDALIGVLMFAFGHGCTDDPLYPWIAATLKDKRIINGEARAERLERKALTWLDHVIASFSEERET